MNKDIEFEISDPTLPPCNHTDYDAYVIKEQLDIDTGKKELIDVQCPHCGERIEHAYKIIKESYKEQNVYIDKPPFSVFKFGWKKDNPPSGREER